MAVDTIEKKFTEADMRAAFLAGEAFEENSAAWENNCDPEDEDFVEEITEPHFGEWMIQEFGINVDKD